MSQKLFILYIEYYPYFLGFFSKNCKNKAKSKKHGISSITLKVAHEKKFHTCKFDWKMIAIRMASRS